jgi:hypothetical protein
VILHAQTNRGSFLSNQIPFLRPRWFTSLLLAATFFAVACVALLGRLQDVNADARGTAVVADSIIRNGSLTLTGDAAGFFRAPKGGYTNQVTATRRGIEYAFPLGPVLIAVPIVFVARLARIDVLRHDGLIQATLVGIAIILTLAFTYSIARKKFGPTASAAASILIFFGTLVGPTMSGAFWSLDCEIVLIAAVISALYSDTESRPALRGGALGFILFLGFLCRPTFSPVILGTFVYLAICNPRKLSGAATVSALLLLSFIVFSSIHFGTYLPPYYLATRLTTATWRIAAEALLGSPSRSIFIFSPVLTLVPFALYRGMRSNRRHLIAVMAGMILAMFLENAFFYKWWAGYSYGPRISSDLTFTACLLILIAVGTVQDRTRKGFAMIAAMLLVIGLPMNVAGIFCRATRLWNIYPNIDEHPELVWDWRYPQFLSISDSRVRAKCHAETIELSLGPFQDCPP